MNGTKYDVLVIGAGAAGLAAGRLLADAGRHVAIVEARDRVGGRIWTRKIEGQINLPVELGAEFIHGLPAATWALVSEAGLQTYELGGAQLWFSDRKLTARGEHQSDSRQVLDKMTDWVAGRPLDGDMSFAEYLKMSAADAQTRKSAANYVEGFNAADQNSIGIAALARQQRAEDAIEADRIFRVEEGYEGIPNFLSKQFVRAGGKLLLGLTVQSIGWKRGAAVVSVRDRAGTGSQLQSDRAVITVPLGVLQAETIDFAPRPAESLVQAHRLAMGAVVRVILVFRSRFWGAQPWASRRPRLERELADLSFLFTPTELPSTWWTPMPRAAPMLTAWVGGPRAEALQRMAAPSPDSEALLNQCLSTLAKVFKLPLEELKNLLVSWHTHDWQGDEYARGAYSYVPAGALDAPERMTRPVEDTLYFAGEHTDTSGHWGTVHAALATGARAAHQVLSSQASQR